MNQKILDTVKDRMYFILDGRKPYVWGESIGWNRGTVDSAFRLGKAPGPRDLAILTVAERVNLSWLLVGEGPPYLVLPLPEPQDLAVDESANYYLLRAPEGIPPPLVCVRHVIPQPEAPLMPATHITVYSGMPAELMRALDWLDWKGMPIYLAQDHVDVVARLRAGLLGNRALINEGKGLLEGQLVAILPGAGWLDPASELPQQALPGPTLDAGEREWMMRWRELTEEQRAALLLIARGLTQSA